MLKFTDLTLSDIETVRPFFSMQNTRICDYSVGGIFMWREFFHSRYALYHDTLIFQVTYLGGITAFTVPLGKDPQGAVEQIEQYCAGSGIPMIFCTVPHAALAMLQQRYPKAQVTPNRDWFDYLYLAQDLANFFGKKYDGQRNHIHKFQRMYPGSAFHEISEENIERVRSFYHDFASQYQKDSPFAREEAVKTAEVLENLHKYSMFGGFLEVDGNIVSISLGERVGDTLFVHIEKADIRYQGAYQVMVQEFVKHFAGDAEFVNREEDVGDAGLRKSKLSYHPVELLEKSTVKCIL